MARAEMDVARLNESVREETLLVQQAVEEVRKVIVGQRGLVERMMVALLCRGHLLLEGVPGLAKTLAVKTLGQALDLKFARIQFTPDLLPADLIGTLIYQQKSGEFVTRKGPVFANLVLADEINRAPAKVQSALLEAMQERQVTIGEATHPLPDPFMVFATQNPIEQEGTYPLPEAQVDRFMLKVKVDYPSQSGGAPDPRPHGHGRGAARRARAVVPRGAEPRGARARDLHGRAAARLHGRARLRHAQAARGGPRRPRAADRVRRLAARHAGVLRGLARRSRSCAAAGTSCPRT